MTSTINVSKLTAANETGRDSNDLFRYFYYDIWQIPSDPMSRDYPLMEGGPWQVLGIVGAYVYFVKHMGPKLMKNRPPYDLRWIMLVYNLCMSAFNGYFFFWIAVYTNFGIRTWGCRPRDHWVHDPLFRWKINFIFLYFVTKFVDLLDSVFFVLRKKSDHLSFLHVYHHAMVPINSWVGLKYVLSESAGFFPFINSLVHFIMYMYYALCCLGPTVRPYLWWKKYLTQLQIVQLTLIAIHCLHLILLNCNNIPKIVFAFWLPQVALLVYLFSTFFAAVYSADRKAKVA